MGGARAEQMGRYESFSGDGVCYVLCSLPEPMEKAAAWFGKQCGGYTVANAHHGVANIRPENVVAMLEEARQYRPGA